MAAYPFTRARYYTPGGMVEVRAILWHMAEGYSTVSYLTHPTLNVSCHYVVERTGRIVQMVSDRDASHSAHVAIDPDDADASSCGGLYSDAIARQVLGTGFRDINAYCIAVEVEGFRSEGPNPSQVDAIDRLGMDLRARHATIRGNLGHRDVQDYKSCPGCRFPWDRIGGHGLLASEPTMGGDDMAGQVPGGMDSGWTVDVPADTDFYADGSLRDRLGATKAVATLPYLYNVIGSPGRCVVVVTGTAYEDKQARPTAVFMDEDDIGTPVKTPPADPNDCGAAILLDRNRAYIAYR